MFVGAKAYNQTVTLLSPLLQLSDEVFPGLGSQTCQISSLGNEVSAVLLVRYAAVQEFYCSRGCIHTPLAYNWVWGRSVAANVETP